ncbi:unnamed protein product [Hermetia illucens]|uniref:Vacuolar fusion protein CCZ1 homolog n=2 Tax=Hermetia illucens TaxID=343691 RepID=A0A7R8UMC2_HERIL|nr:unnamed protein product [Hermetia illucens]
MTGRVEMSLRNFFIFNSQYGKKEGEEHQKIFFYHPADIDLNTKVKDVGLCEAIIHFTNNFTSSDGCQALNTQKTSQIFYLPEKDFWMVMTLNAPWETKTRDGNEYTEYRGGDMHTTIYRAVLRQAYQMFRLFAGTFEMNFVGETEAEKIENLKKKLEVFYSKYLLTIKLKSCDILDVVQSIQYLPLERMLFLRIHTFINMIEETFPRIQKCIFLYNDQLVWSEVSPSDLYSIYEYLTGTLFQKAKETELKGGSLKRSYSLEGSRHGSFITGPESPDSQGKAPKVFVTSGSDLRSYYMVVYRALTASICLLVNAESPPTEDFYSELHSFMGPQLSSIASKIGESYAKSATGNPAKIGNEQDCASPKYLFINELTLRHTGTVHVHPQRPNTPALPLFVTNLIADLYDSKRDLQGKYEETVVKALNDYWVVKRTSNWREFYVIVNNNKATLLDITNEANKLFEQQITNVFFEK